MKVVAPPDALLERYHQLVAPMFAEIRTLARQTANLRRTRDLLLPRLLSGKVALEPKVTVFSNPDMSLNEVAE